MKNIFIIALLSLAIQEKTCAQNPDRVLYEVSYQFLHVRDTNNPHKYYQEEFMLRIGRNASEFLSLTQLLNNKKMQDQVAQASAGGTTEVNLGVWKPSTPEKIFTWQKEKKLYKTIRFRSTVYQINYPLEHINWKIGSSTKTIAGYKCQLATGAWKGRLYQAWFCTDLPFTTGPWKLHGLPGLILEAKDEKSEVIFTAKSVEKKTADSSLITLPTRAVTLTEFQFKRMVTAPPAGAQAEDVKVQAKISGSSTSPSKGKEINNPLEKSSS